MNRQGLERPTVSNHLSNPFKCPDTSSVEHELKIPTSGSLVSHTLSPTYVGPRLNFILIEKWQPH